MTDQLETRFDNLDSARQYVKLLCEALRDARQDVANDIRTAADEGAQRRRRRCRLRATSSTGSRTISRRRASC